VKCFRPLFHVSVSGSGCVSGRFQCGRPIPRFSIRQTYLPVLPYYKQCLHNNRYHSHENAISFYPQCGEKYFHIIYTCHISRIGLRWADYGFDIYRENHCDFANLTQDTNLNNKDHFGLYRDVHTFW